MPSAHIRVAIVGAGRMGRHHLRAAEAVPGVAVSAVVDPVAAARDAVAARVPRTFPTIADLLGEDRPDAAVVAAPTGGHLDAVRALAAAGVPILCEKPCGLRSVDARAAATAAGEAGVLLQVAYWRRFVPALARLREQIAEGAFGTLGLVTSWQWDEQPPPPSFRRTSGGIAIDMGVHEFDQVRWLTGQEFAHVHAVASDQLPEPEAPDDPDTLTVAAGLSGGTAATVSLGRWHPPGDACWVEVLGTRRVERCAFMAGAGGERMFRFALVAQLEAFVAAVAGGSPARGATAGDAVAALEVAERATGAQVRVGRRA